MLREAQQVCWLPLDRIDGGADTKDTAEEQQDLLDGLFLPPLLVEPLSDGRYRDVSDGGLLARYRRAGVTEASAIICPPQDADAEIARLLGDLASGRMHFLDAATRCGQLLRDAPMTAQELALRLGLSPATLRRRLRLLELDSDTCELIRATGVSEGHALALLRLPGQKHRLRLLRQAAERGLTVRQTEDAVEEMLRRLPVPVPQERKLRPAMRDHRLYVNAIRDIVEQMQGSGLQATMQVTQASRSMEVRVTLPLLRPAR